MSSRYKRKGKAKFLLIEGYLIRSTAWQHATPNDRALYLELKWRYDGFNNGRIGLSIRDAADALGIGKNAVSMSFSNLQSKGFVAVVTKGAFSVKVKRATEWLLTEYKCDVTGELPRKDFMRWRPEEKITVLSQVRSVPPQGHLSTPEAQKYG
ncbi:hypothetical protein [Mesorhizobium silamurunense]|uniref:hypothetical protein n=1 Tax=Mesorhizobium silamurunense TaxID=499528 RepID=UPI0017853876|nr:hypothetical protein [Mesorhizobium silamurunense]